MAKTKKTAGEELTDRIRRAGEKGVKGLKGFYEFKEKYSPRAPLYLAVEIVGIEMDGCTPRLKVRLLAGRGEFFLDSPCQFIRSEEEIDRITETRRRAAALKKDKEHLEHYRGLISEQTRRLQEYFVQKVPGGYSHPTVAAELEADGLNVDNPRLLSRHLDKYRRTALTIVHGSHDPDSLSPEDGEDG